MNNQTEFSKHTTTTNRDGRWQINCNRGLWGVDAPTKKQAVTEAIPYFFKYWMDGEYDTAGENDEQAN